LLFEDNNLMDFAIQCDLTTTIKEIRNPDQHPRGQGHHLFQLEIGGRSPMWDVAGATPIPSLPQPMRKPIDEAGANIPTPDFISLHVNEIYWPCVTALTDDC